MINAGDRRHTNLTKPAGQPAEDVEGVRLWLPRRRLPKNLGRRFDHPGSEYRRSRRVQPARFRLKKIPPSYDQIARRAYEIWQSGKGGSQDENWFRAEVSCAACKGDGGLIVRDRDMNAERIDIHSASVLFCVKCSVHPRPCPLGGICHSPLLPKGDAENAVGAYNLRYERPTDQEDFSAVPLFPLPNVVLFPGAVLPLHIFEERYKRDDRGCAAGQRQVAMALLRPGWEKNYYGRPAIEPVVCVGTILSHERLADGRYNFLLQGHTRAQVVAGDGRRAVPGGLELGAADRDGRRRRSIGRRAAADGGDVRRRRRCSGCWVQ